MLSICKRFECGISYSHALPGYDGKCKNLHGHNAVVEVEVSGRDIFSYKTMVMDFSKLKNLVTSILSEMDHKDLTSFFWCTRTGEIISHQVGVHRGLLPGGAKLLPATAEIIVQYLAKEIKSELQLHDSVAVELVRVRVSETPDSWAEWKEKV